MFEARSAAVAGKTAYTGRPPKAPHSLDATLITLPIPFHCVETTYIYRRHFDALIGPVPRRHASSLRTSRTNPDSDGPTDFYRNRYTGDDGQHAVGGWLQLSEAEAGARQGCVRI